MDNGLNWADYAVVIGFFAVMLGIGLYFRNKVKNMGDFFGGGRQVPWWLAGISFYMCTFSALGFVVYSSLAYQYGWTAVTIYWVTVPAMLIVAKFLAHRWRRVAKTSPLEYIECRYGKKMVNGLVWLGIPTRVLDDGLKLLAIGTIIAAGMGFPLAPAIIVSGIIIISYTFMGGLWAALVADFIQFIILLAAVIVLPFLAMDRVGGVDNFVQSAPEGFFALMNAKYSWHYILVFFLIILLNNSSSWALVQRFYATESDKDARKVGYFVAILNFIGPPIFYIPAMAARVFLPDMQNANEVYAVVCKELLPIGMLGMIIAAMFSATMSTLAGDFNAMASVLTNDIYKRVKQNNLSDRKLMFVARLNTFIVGIIVIGIAFMIRKFQGADDLFTVMVKIFGLFLPPVAIPMLLGMLTKKVSDFGGLAGLFSGIIAGVAAFALGHWYPALRQEQLIFLLTTFVTLSGIFIGTKLWPNDSGRQYIVDQFIDNIANNCKTLEKSKDGTAGSLISPFPIIGLGILLIGFILSFSVALTKPMNEGILSITIGVGMVILGLYFLVLGKKIDRKSHKYMNGR